MREFLAYSLDRKPRSLAFLDEVRSNAASRLDAAPPIAAALPVPAPAVEV